MGGRNGEKVNAPQPAFPDVVRSTAIRDRVVDLVCEN
jgi:hypothetical protein